jgi:hypothetical protein
MSTTKAATDPRQWSNASHAIESEETEMTQTLISRPAVRVVPELLERCDRCGASAKVQVSFPTAGDLVFCGHHANRYTDRILATADRIAIETGFDWRGADA